MPQGKNRCSVEEQQLLDETPKQGLHVVIKDPMMLIARVANPDVLSKPGHGCSPVVQNWLLYQSSMAP